MYQNIDPVEPAFEEVLIGLVLERIRHDSFGIRNHAILGDNGITFDATRAKHGNVSTIARDHNSRRHRKSGVRSV